MVRLGETAAIGGIFEPSFQVLFSSASKMTFRAMAIWRSPITSETTMLKQAALALCLTLPVTRGVSADPDIVDVSTWRWNVSSILSSQRDAEINPPTKVASLRAKLFDQQYERYWPNGARDAASKWSGR